MIDALVTGKMVGEATQRTGKNGRPFTLAKVRVPTGEDSLFCHVISFSDSAQAALLTLGDGDAVALAGSLTLGTWVDRDGESRPSLSMKAEQVLTAYHVSRKRKAMQPQQDATHPDHEGGARSTQQRAQQGPSPDDLDDGGPLDF